MVLNLNTDYAKANKLIHNPRYPAFELLCICEWMVEEYSKASLLYLCVNTPVICIPYLSPVNWQQRPASKKVLYLFRESAVLFSLMCTLILWFARPSSILNRVNDNWKPFIVFAAFCTAEATALTRYTYQ